MSLLRPARRAGLCCIAATSLLSVAVFPSAGHAQPGGNQAQPEKEPSGDASTPDAVQPPVLLSEVNSVAPPDVELEQAVYVDLELTIDERGSVTDVRVMDAPMADLADAAQRSARGFQFQPARVGTTPTAVVIEYRYWFRPEPQVPDAPTETKARATEQNASQSASEARGDIDSPPATAPPPQQAHSKPSPSARPTEDEEVFEAVAEAPPPPRETTKRTIPVQRIVRVPGTRGDALRSIEILPGVARAPQGVNPIIRGSAQSESTTFIDGTQLPLLYHFGGVTSVIPSRLLESVELYPGNFSARYGRVSGGIIEARLKDPAPEHFGAVVDLSLVDSGAIVEAPINDDIAVAAGVRRSNIDFVFDSFVPDGTFNVVAAPLYWDYQNIWNIKLGRDQRLRVAVFGTRDQLKLIFAEPSRVDPQFDGNVSGALEHHRLQLLHDVRFSGVRQSLNLTFGKDVLRQRFGVNAHAHLDAWVLDGRGQWDIPVGTRAEITAGFDAQSQFYSGAYLGSAASASEGDAPFPDGSRGELLVNQTTFELIAPALWAEAALHPIDGWTLVPGFRADYFHHLSALTLNPRFSQRVNLSEQTVVKSGIGWFSQAPLYYESLEPVGNADIKPYHAMHVSLGVESQLGDFISIGSEGFYKYLYDRIVGTEGGVPPRLINEGRGRIYGIESSIDFAPSPSSFATMTYTLSRSERQDREEPWRLFDEDQTHIFNLAASAGLGAGWELGGRFRYVTGNPYTPVQRAVYDAGRDTYVPEFGGINSGRNAAFHQLDVRLEKQFRFEPMSLALYLDIQNVYNRQNPEGYDYSYDYSKREQVTGTPFFPNFGVRGEL